MQSSSSMNIGHDHEEINRKEQVSSTEPENQGQDQEEYSENEPFSPTDSDSQQENGADPKNGHDQEESNENEPASTGSSDIQESGSDSEDHRPDREEINGNEQISSSDSDSTDPENQRHVNEVNNGNQPISLTDSDTFQIDTDSEKSSYRRNRPRFARTTSLLLGLVAMGLVGYGTYYALDSKDVKVKKRSSQHENFQGSVSPAALEEHDEPEDCWLAIHGNVYDLTDYAPTHPGGAEYITDFCGMDATRDYDIEHSTALLPIIENALLGTFTDEKEEAVQTDEPTPAETRSPTVGPSNSPNVPEKPSSAPSFQDTTYSPSSAPTRAPRQTEAPLVETKSPSMFPTRGPVSAPPVVGTEIPSSVPSKSPTKAPRQETPVPTMNQVPTPSPTLEIPFWLRPQPTDGPTVTTTNPPTKSPTDGPSVTVTNTPTKSPTDGPTVTATNTPTKSLTEFPTHSPTKSPTRRPTEKPTRRPTKRPTPNPTPRPTPSPTPNPTEGAPDSQCRYSLRDVAQHSDRDDCWYILYGVVYDFTDYVDEHPGGARRVFQECGTDATVAYSEEKKHDEKLLAKKASQYIIGCAN